MTEIIIHIDGDAPLAVLDQRGWTKGVYGNFGVGPVCMHGAIRLCQPQPGDAQIIEQVETRLGYGTDWNDDGDRTETEVREFLAAGIDITDEMLADTFGPQWRAVVNLVRRAAVLTSDEVGRLSVSRDRLSVSRDTTKAASWDASLAAARVAARTASWVAAGAAARVAAGAVVTWDLATADGPYTFEHRDLLIAPWREVCGLPEGLVDQPNDEWKM